MLFTVIPHGPSLVRELPGESDLRRLGRRVRLDAGEADAQPGAAGDVHDASPARRLHARRHGLRTVERAVHVHGEDRLPFLRRDLFQRSSHLAEHAACVVHQDVHAPRRRGCLGDERVHRGLVADVDDARRALAVGGRAQPGRLVQFGLQHVAGPHVGAALGEGEGDGAAEAVGGAGDDCRCDRRIAMFIPQRLRGGWRRARPVWRATARACRSRCRGSTPRAAR